MACLSHLLTLDKESNLLNKVHRHTRNQPEAQKAFQKDFQKACSPQKRSILNKSNMYLEEQKQLKHNHELDIALTINNTERRRNSCAFLTNDIFNNDTPQQLRTRTLANNCLKNSILNIGTPELLRTWTSAGNCLKNIAYCLIDQLP